MTWKTFVGPLVRTSRRKVVTSSIIYGVALTVRLTSSTGERYEHAVQAAPANSPQLSIMIKDESPSFKDRSVTSTRPIVFHRSWPQVRECRAGCERPIQLASMLDCADP